MSVEEQQQQQQQPRLDECAASDLATYLLRRFEGDAMETTSFLLECTQCLPDAEAISATIMGGGGDDDDDDDDATDDNDEGVEAEEVVAVSRDSDEEEVEEEEDEESANDVSSGKVIVLPESIAEDKKKSSGGDGGGDGSPTPSPPTKRTSVEVSATTPRGKFDLTIHESTGLILRNKKDEVVTVPSSSVDTVIVFPKAEDCRKSSDSSKKKGPAKRRGSLVLVVFKKKEEDTTGVTFRGKDLKQICFQLPQSIVSLPNSDKEGSDGDDEEEGKKSNDIELECIELLAKTFDMPSERVVLVSNPAYLTDDGREERTYCGRYEFKSDETKGTSTTTSGMPFVKCYESVNDGVLYPLEEGLLFFKPPKFVPRAKLHNIQCGRGGGDSRYVDLMATLEEDEGMVEFSNIAREEVRVLNDYIHKVLIKAMAKDAAEGEKGGDGSSSEVNDSVVEVIEVTSGDDDEEASSSDEVEEGNRKRSRRTASRDAREATKAQLQAKAAGGEGGADDSEDEDEEDFKMESDVESSSESEGDDDDEEEALDATESEDDDKDESDEEDASPKKKGRTA